MEVGETKDLVCIDNKGFEDAFEIGKTYSGYLYLSIDAVYSFVVIVNSIIYRNLPIEFFQDKAYIRNDKINALLDNYYEPNYEFDAMIKANKRAEIKLRLTQDWIVLSIIGVIMGYLYGAFWMIKWIWGF